MNKVKADLNVAVAPVQRSGRRKKTGFLENKDQYLIWILAPYLETDDPNLKYYYDYTQSIAEYTRVFGEVGCEWKWQNVTINDIEKSVLRIKNYPTTKKTIVINLCDGDESNAVPGLSVIAELEKHNLIYTGSDDFFYEITTSKIPMKQAFDSRKVPTAKWKVIESGEEDYKTIFKEIGKTLIVKPAVSAGSMGLTVKNVVSTEKEFEDIVNEMRNGYRGWKLDTGGIFVEEFVNGREFTTLVVGSSTKPKSLRCYTPIERVFHESLPEKEQFLSFDRLWETYDTEKPIEAEGFLYNYKQADEELIETLKEISIKAFRSVGGMGYGRLDIRMDKNTGKFYVLEVNAQCGLSEDENYTSIGAILRFDGKSFTHLIVEILEDAVARYQSKHQ
ncbi:MAG: ATP-grasp domain-containing protein [Cyclobacteriaceae bacterium]|nr:ATP-grasp domain-containing protein [Cyclobacteriaceae bacterium]